MRKYVNILTTLSAIVLLNSCDTTHSAQQSQASYGPEPREVITQSLFNDSDRTISEEDIQRLLSGRIRIPDTLNVALFNFAGTSINRYYTSWWTDEEYLKTQQSFVDTLMSRIATSRKVRKIFPVPSLMAARHPNITQLREAAVRLQADMLIVYSITSDIYYKYRAFQKNQAKAFATCEVVAMDIRTGMIPHSSIITREKLVVRYNQDELSDQETRKKAEREAVLAALTDSGNAISAYLETN